VDFTSEWLVDLNGLFSLQGIREAPTLPGKHFEHNH